jgi:hypothetical protein
MTPAAAPTVFIIDDDAGIRASIQGLLRSREFRCLKRNRPARSADFRRSHDSDRPITLRPQKKCPGPIVRAWGEVALVLRGRLICD